MSMPARFAWLRVRSLKTRIALLFLSLMLVVQLASFLAIRSSIADNGRTAVREQLIIGQRVFLRLIEQETAKLTQGARILAADYGFRSAIGSDDRETIESAIQNHGERIGATVALFYSAQGRIKASTATALADAERERVDRLVVSAGSSGAASGFAMLGGHLHQIVVVPVRSPALAGWVVMGFAVDQRLARDMRELSAIHLSFLLDNGEADRHWQLVASSLPDNQSQALAAGLDRPATGQAPDSAAQPREIRLAGDAFGTVALPLLKSDRHQVVAVLQRSIDEVVAPYARLQLVLAVLTVLGLLVSALGSMMTARRISRPVMQLADSARRLGQGDYQAHVDVLDDDEVGDLARAFDHMRAGIAEREGRIRKLAYWDPLTGLPNRAMFLLKLEDCVTAAQQAGDPCAVVMMDLNRFKHVNDVLGHGFGDRLLQAFAGRIAAELDRPVDLLARLGGDEFAIMLPRTDAAAALSWSARLSGAMQAPIIIDGHAIDLGAGIGIAAYPVHADCASLLLARAEIAMYGAKRRTGGALVYDPQVDDSSQENLSLVSELRRAIDADELLLHFQPKLSLATGELVGVETLVRWVHPQRGFVPPDKFIPFAEHTGVIREITTWVLRRAAAQCAAWQAQGLHLKIAVNLSTRDLMDQDLPSRVLSLLAGHGVSPASFCLEITESAIMDDPARALQTLDALHAAGFELSIDDFGTGYSSLAYLKQLPVCELKIDRSFVAGMAGDRDDAVIVASTIDLGHNLGLRVVAEGIETEQTWQMLAQAGCDQGQGYLMSKPLPADQLTAWARQRAAAAGAQVALAAAPA